MVQTLRKRRGTAATANTDNKRKPSAVATTRDGARVRLARNAKTTVTVRGNNRDGAVKKVVITRKTTRRTTSSKKTEETIKPIESIRDFKKMEGKTYYLVHRTGTTATQDTWEPEQAIEALDILSAFRERVQTASGYTIDNATSSTTTTMSTTDSQIPNVRRSTRTSKTRAMLRMTDEQVVIDSSSESESDGVSRGGRRKRASSSSGSSRKKRSASEPKPKKLRGQAARKAAEAEDRQQRKQDRQAKSDDAIVDIDETDCCLGCSVLLYRQAVENNDLEKIKAILEDKKKVPHWSKENCQHWSDYVLSAAMLKENKEIVGLLLQDLEGERVVIPTKYTDYGSNTGYVSRYTFGHAVSKVNESRGNRQGNSAFYRKSQKNILEVDISRLNEGHISIAIMNALQNTELDPDMVDFMKTGISNPTGAYRAWSVFMEQKGLYYCVASGNRAAAAAIMERIQYRSGFNTIHANVLKFTNGETLETYRRNQILKKSYDCGSITPLECAAIHPSRAYLKELYDELTPAERMETDEFGRTIAHFAAASTTPDCLEYLIEQDFPFGTPDKFKLTPLIQAARFGRHQNIRPLLKHLSKGDVPNTEFADQTLLRQRWRPLHYAAYFGHAETCRELIDCGATIEAVESSLHATPLLFAAQRGHVECVKVLIEHGKADPEAVDKYARTPLHLASINGKYDVVKYLLQDIGVNADAADTSQNRPIHYAAGFGHHRLLRLLIEMGDADPAAHNVWRTTACSVANLKGHISIVQYMLTECNIDVNFKDQDGKTLLHHCVEEEVTSKFEAEQVLRKTRLLISKKADPNIQTIKGNTVLHSFAIGRYNAHRPSGWVNEDEEHNVNIKRLEYDDMDGIEFSRQLAKLLLDAGANLDMKNSEGDTPLALAIDQNKDYVMDIFIEHGAKYWDTMSSTGMTFFQSLIATSSELDMLNTRREMDRTRWNRFEQRVKVLWRAVENNPVPASVETNINSVSKEGNVPILGAVFDACENQRNHVKQEKERIKAKHISKATSYAQGARNEDRSSREDVIFEFRFEHFISMATRVIEKFHPDMNTVIQLPKDFFKNNPKRSKSEYPPHTGFSALHMAASTQDATLLRFLMSQGCDPNQRMIIDGVPSNAPPMLSGYFKKTFQKSDYLDNTDLQTVEYTNKIYNIIKPDFNQLLPNAVKEYLSFGANPCIANDHGLSTMMAAAKSLDDAIIEDLCAAYTKSSFEGIDNRDTKKYTALMYAVDAIQQSLKNNKDKVISVLTVQHLLSAGANPNTCYKHSNNGDTVMMKVIRLQYPALIDTVIQHTQCPIDHSIVNNSMETCAIIASKIKNEYISKTYFNIMATSYESSPFNVNVGDKHHNTALLLASKYGNEHAATVLLKCKADPNYIIEASKNLSPLAQSIQNTNLNIAQHLLKAGANVNYQDNQGLSPLHHAVLVEKYHLVKLMLEFGADVHAIDKKKRTPLHVAIQQTKNMTNASLRIERLLLQGGSDINAKDILGRTPLHLAFIHMNIIPHMRKMADIGKKVKKFIQDKKERETLEENVTKSVEKYGRDTKDATSNNWIAHAVRIYLENNKPKKPTTTKNNSVSTMDEDEVIIDQDEIPTLELYSQFQWEIDTTLPTKVDPIDIIKFLSQFDGLKYDTADEFGRTPLHYAAAVGAFSSTSILLAKGVNINAQDLDQNTPLQLALRYKHVDYSVMLCDQGAIPSSVMTLPVGDSITTLNYSLSQDFMNMAYLILDRDPNILESLQDSLRTGKFHVADILLNSAPASALSGKTAEGCNLWHILANFKPFNKEIWDEYLPDVIAKVAELGLPFETDVHQRTPIHYAAMHGQSTLLNNLLSAGGSEINQLDEDGLSELWHATSSQDIHSIQLLVKAGARFESGTSTAAKDSTLLLAVKSKNIYLVKTLLEFGAPKDGDSVHGRPNAVMQACMDKSDNILKELLDANADPNVPSTATYTLKGKKELIVIHPVFIATDSTFKVLINGGADPNVMGPKEEPWYGRSCFMYLSNSSNNNQSLMLLLEHKANLDLMDLNSERSIFYHYMFDDNLPNRHHILSHMMQNFEPNVNLIDPETGMTPLEFSIRKHNAIHVERLLELGANPNVASCRKTTSKKGENMDLIQWGPLNAIFHAVAQNDLTALQTICHKTKHNIDWKATDNDGRSIVSFLICTHYSHENTDILKFIVETTESDFDALAELADKKGLRAIDYAHSRGRKEFFDELVKVGITLEDVEMETADDVEEGEQSMIVDEYIAMQAIEEDAEAERALLKAEAKARAEANGDSQEEEKEDETHVVDPLSKMTNIGRLAVDENNVPYDIMVQKVEVGAYYYGCNMFYKLSVIYNTILDLYVLWTRWGSIGESGMHQKTPFLTKEEAVNEFKSIFRSKTGNTWENHTPETFEPKPGRFELMAVKPPKKPVLLKDFEFVETSVPSQLPPAIYNAMNIFCDFEALNQGYKQLELDIPAGHIPQKRIDEAYKVLNQLSKLIKKYEAETNFTTKEGRAKKRDMGHEIVQWTNKYYRLLPKTSHTKGIFAISRKHNLQEELARLNNVNYLNFSINVLLAAKRRASEIHPLDYCFRSLHCQLNEIEKNTPEFNMVQKYMLTTAKQSGYEITHLFGVDREGEAERFEPHANNSNRKLLWHGSHTNNFLGILKQGLRTKPAIAQQNGSMFGNGVYFADMFAKSVMYSNNGFYEKKHPGYALLLLCEVALGEESEMSYHAMYKYDEEKHMSVRGMGKEGPNPANAIYDKRGVRIPMGPTMQYPIPSDIPYYDQPKINHNEFIVYDDSQIKIKYMVLVRNNNYCELCQSYCSGSSIANLSDYQVRNDVILNGHSSLGEYERGLIRFWTTHSGKTEKELFYEHLDTFLESQSYKPRWKPSMPITRNSRVCTSCTQTMATMLFVQQAENQLPEIFQQRETCQYGEKCNKKNDVHHAKVYKHWFLPNVKEDKVKNTEESSIEEVDDDSDDMSDSDAMDSDDE
ncbi:hypothetical protein BDA99DRAFT_51448 [Phascolomyces articulosus]|uniref:Poly [ADP-ribose] polymerase n=1 Tax=Phascolomyces articulosus TaxID=60185 RepID=A0AAD5PEM0_9FUNG|nr:hypothetical protein BDA99DRAFT_51448 [Phascolomyces articulosus]